MSDTPRPNTSASTIRQVVHSSYNARATESINLLGNGEVTHLNQVIGNRALGLLIQSQLQNKTTNVQLFPITKVEKVRSLEIEFGEQSMQGALNLLKKKFQLRDLHLDELLKQPGNDRPILERLKARWSGVKAHLASPGTASLPSDSDIKNGILLEERDQKLLKGSRNKYFRNDIKELIEALKKYDEMYGNYHLIPEEHVAYHQFDKDFNAPDIKKLLGSISSANFTPADIKAVVGQETRDLTNTEIAGISKSKLGLKFPKENPANKARNDPGFFAGLGQTRRDVVPELLKSAKALKVDVSSQNNKDPRQAPSTSIMLVAAQFVRIDQLLRGRLPKPQPTGDEYKKLVFASYKDGQGPVIEAAQEYKKGKQQQLTYAWDDIKTSKFIGDDCRQYVERVITRLTNR